MEIDFVSQLLTQYGLAGIVIYLFYKIITNHFKDLGDKVDRLSEKIDKLIEVIERKL